MRFSLEWAVFKETHLTTYRERNLEESIQEFKVAIAFFHYLHSFMDIILLSGKTRAETWSCIYTSAHSDPPPAIFHF